MPSKNSLITKHYFEKEKKNGWTYPSAEFSRVVANFVRPSYSIPPIAVLDKKVRAWSIFEIFLFES